MDFSIVKGETCHNKETSLFVIDNIPASFTSFEWIHGQLDSLDKQDAPHSSRKLASL